MSIAIGLLKCPDQPDPRICTEFNLVPVIIAAAVAIVSPSANSACVSGEFVSRK